MIKSNSSENSSQNSLRGGMIEAFISPFHKCSNTEDRILYESLPEDPSYIYKIYNSINGSIECYNIISLFEYIMSTNNPLDLVTNKPLNNEIINDIVNKMTDIIKKIINDVIIASNSGDLDIIKDFEKNEYIIAYKLKPDTMQKIKSTLFENAVKAGHLNIIEYLIDNITLKNKENVFIIARNTGNLKIVKLLLENIDKDVDKLVNSDPNFNKGNDSNDSILDLGIINAIENEYYDIVEYIVNTKFKQLEYNMDNVLFIASYNNLRKTVNYVEEKYGDKITFEITDSDSDTERSFSSLIDFNTYN